MQIVRVNLINCIQGLLGVLLLFVRFCPSSTLLIFLNILLICKKKTKLLGTKIVILLTETPNYNQYMNRAYSTSAVWSLMAEKGFLSTLHMHTRTIGISYAKLKEEKLLLKIA